jgi:hypothetical protein
MVTVWKVLVVPTGAVYVSSPGNTVTGAAPDPLSGIISGSPTFSVADLTPGPLGEKVTVMGQLPPAGSVEGESGQLVETEKSLALGPVIVAPVIASPTLCGFVRVTVWGALVVPSI